MRAESIVLYTTSQYTNSVRSHQMNAYLGTLLVPEVESTITSSSDSTVSKKESSKDGEEPFVGRLQLYNYKSRKPPKPSSLTLYTLHVTN